MLKTNVVHRVVSMSVTNDRRFVRARYRMLNLCAHWCVMPIAPMASQKRDVTVRQDTIEALRKLYGK